jgi:hypothetical protein
MQMCSKQAGIPRCREGKSRTEILCVEIPDGRIAQGFSDEMCEAAQMYSNF